MTHDSCLFCKFAAAAPAPTNIVYQNERALAFLDIHPHAPGHTVVIPRAHRARLAELAENELDGLFSMVQRVSGMLEKALGAQALTIGINQGALSGNTIEHLHVHLMPRFAGDGGTSLHTVVNNPPKESLETIVEKIKSAH